MSFISQTRDILRRVNVEPVCFLYCVFLSLFYNTQAPFFFFKCCVDTFSSELKNEAIDFCQNLTRDNKTDDFNAVERRTAPYLQYNQIVLNVPGIFASLVIGSLSDRIGRKLPLVLALVDSLLGSMAYTFVAVFPQTSIYVMLAGGGLGSMMGGSMVIFLLAFSSVRDLNKDPSTYSFHLAITSSTVALGIVTGALTSGLLISRLSYARVFLTSQICMALAIFWAIFFLRETYRLHTDMDDFSINTISTPGEQKKPITWQSICNSIGVNKVFQTVFKLRPNRASLLIAMLTFQLVLFAEMGADSLILPYAKYPPLLWPDQYYGYFNAFTAGLAAIGMPMWTLALKKQFDLADTTMIIGALLFSAAKLAFYSLSKTTFEFFAAGSLTMFSHLYFPNFRSLVSGLVSRDETGKIYSILSISESVAPLLSAVVFNNIFLATLTIFAGFIFALGSTILLVCSFVIVYVHFLLKRSQPDEVPFLTQDSVTIADQEEICDT